MKKIGIQREIANKPKLMEERDTQKREGQRKMI